MKATVYVLWRNNKTLNLNLFPASLSSLSSARSRSHAGLACLADNKAEDFVPLSSVWSFDCLSWQHFRNLLNIYSCGESSANGTKRPCNVTLGIVPAASHIPNRVLPVTSSKSHFPDNAQICTCKTQLSAGGQRFYVSALLMSLPWINKQVGTELFHSTHLTGPSCSIKQGHC